MFKRAKDLAPLLNQSRRFDDGAKPGREKTTELFEQDQPCWRLTNAVQWVLRRVGDQEKVTDLCFIVAGLGGGGSFEGTGRPLIPGESPGVFPASS